MKPITKESEYLYTLDETAELLGLSRSMVGDAQRSALEKLRTALTERGYVADDFLEMCDEKPCITGRSIRRSDAVATPNSAIIHQVKNI